MSHNRNVHVFEKKKLNQSGKLPGKAPAVRREQGGPGLHKGERAGSPDRQEQEAADRRKAAAAKAVATKERKAAKAAAEAEAAEERAEMQKQLKAARKEKRSADKKAAAKAKKKKTWAATTAERKRAKRKDAKEAHCFEKAIVLQGILNNRTVLLSLAVRFAQNGRLLPQNGRLLVHIMFSF